MITALGRGVKRLLKGDGEKRLLKGEGEKDRLQQHLLSGYK